ncbi:hypothetical protein SBC1_78800 (plasmid) [Caballeronia sp. SBC1]|nr:hypothetical protein SBC1_78800 [Caballeronia sp. SBC1]
MHTRTIDARTVRTVLHLCQFSRMQARERKHPWQVSLGAVSRIGPSEIASIRRRHFMCALP